MPMTLMMLMMVVMVIDDGDDDGGGDGNGDGDGMVMVMVMVLALVMVMVMAMMAMMTTMEGEGARMYLAPGSFAIACELNVPHPGNTLQTRTQQHYTAISGMGRAGLMNPVMGARPKALTNLNSANV